MQRGQNQVSGQRGLHGDLRRFKVADLAYHDDVGVLAQNCAQGRCERQIDFGVDLSLADARQIVLDWILDREDVGGTGIESPQSRVQRGGVAAAGWASKQENYR